MDKFFMPVQNPSTLDEIKPRGDHHHHHFHHHQDPHSHRYTMLDDKDKNPSTIHGNFHLRHQSHYNNDGPHAHHHQTPQPFMQREDNIQYNQHTPVTLSRASSSSFSSSSSSCSTSSWFTEESTNDSLSLHHAMRPQHSLSCSNILDVRRDYQENDQDEPIVFATVKHGPNSNLLHRTNGSSQHNSNRVSSLDRGHSRSEEGLLQGNKTGPRGDSRVSHINGLLYKTASLNRSLAFSEEDILLGVSRGPKRAVSSSQLPSKGILKNKEPSTDIRKTKSMEVLTPKGKGDTQGEIQQVRSEFVQAKLQFSAFLDEITKQVMSPSDLTVFGVNITKKAEMSPAHSPRRANPVTPQLPPKKHRESSGEEKDRKQHHSQDKVSSCTASTHSDCANPDKVIAYAARNPHGCSPPHPPHPSSHTIKRGDSQKNQRPSPSGDFVSNDRFGRSAHYFTDGTSTSPELCQPKKRHPHKQHHTGSHSHFPRQPQEHGHQQEQPASGHPGPSSSSSSSAQNVSVGLGSESLAQSDSFRVRDTTFTATSHSSDKAGGRCLQHMGYRDTVFDVDHLRALQEENADLQQNLLQTVVCIESLEVELQRCRDELSQVKEKYKSLLETHTGTKEANNQLGKQLQVASESLSSERKFLLNRVSQMSSELEDAHRTIAALESINVPCLIKDILEKHLNSAEALQRFLTVPASNSGSASSPQPLSPKMEEVTHDWLTNTEAGPQRVTAFVPFKQGSPTTTTTTEANLPSQQESSNSPFISTADISPVLSKKMAGVHTARPQPVYPQNLQQSPLGPKQSDTKSNLQQVAAVSDCWCGKGGVNGALLEHNLVDVTSVSAQQILDEFMQQLQAHNNGGGGTELQVREEWVEGVKPTAEEAD